MAIRFSSRSLNGLFRVSSYFKSQSTVATARSYPSNTNISSESTSAPVTNSYRASSKPSYTSKLSQKSAPSHNDAWNDESDPTSVAEAVAPEPDFNLTYSSGVSSSKKTSSSVSPFPFPEETHSDYSLASYRDAGKGPFPEEIQRCLMKPIDSKDIEIKPDGIIYLPEIKYRQVLFKAFGPGGWALVPRGPHTLQQDVLTREYELICHGQVVAVSRGSAAVRGFSNAAASSESVKSNALMRCCKDLGIAHELWNPLFIAKWKEEFAEKKQVSSYGTNKSVWGKKAAPSKM